MIRFIMTLASILGGLALLGLVSCLIGAAYASRLIEATGGHDDSPRPLRGWPDPIGSKDGDDGEAP
jgi:hypothetical protein